MSQFDLPESPTAEAFDSVLQHHVIDTWFPRSLDLEQGGFLCDFDHAWRPCGPHEKLLEFQARQTLFAAEASQFYPGDERLREAALHGYRYLRDIMWDAGAGGWFHRLDRAGRPLEAHTKHAHGVAYAIEACVAVHESTGEPGALDLAREGFRWLDDHARDREHGGYFGFLTRDGAVIRKPSECPWTAATDTIGSAIGLKDTNVHSDLLETFIHLHRAWPDPKVGERLSEIVEILCAKMIERSTGALHHFFAPDWTPVPHLARFGHEVQTAYRLSTAIGATGNEGRLRTLACRLMDHALRHGWDERAGGFFYAAPGSAPPAIEGESLIVRKKAWWVQAEALKGLLAVSRLEPENASYLRQFELLWRYCRRHGFDARHGGMHAVCLDVLPSWRRALGPSLAPISVSRKGSAWKDASHEGRACLDCISILRGADETRAKKATSLSRKEPFGSRAGVDSNPVTAR